MVRKTTPFACVICTVLFFAPVFRSVQIEGQEIKPLGDLAREQRRKNEKEGKQPTKVYTNDDFPVHPPAEPPTASAATTEKVNGDEESYLSAQASEPHDEKYFRSKMDELRANLESDKEVLASLQEEMDKHTQDAPPFSSDYGTPPQQVNNNAAEMEAGTYNLWLSEGERLRTSIDSQKEKIATDEKGISDLVDQCRRESCQPGWIR